MIKVSRVIFSPTKTLAECFECLRDGALESFSYDGSSKGACSVDAAHSRLPRTTRGVDNGCSRGLEHDVVLMSVVRTKIPDGSRVAQRLLSQVCRYLVGSLFCLTGGLG
jgi:hypothetical protein